MIKNVVGICLSGVLGMGIGAVINKKMEDIIDPNDSDVENAFRIIGGIGLTFVASALTGSAVKELVNNISTK